MQSPAEMQAQLNRLETLVRMLVEAQRPQITFAEIHQRLGHGSTKTTQRWIKAQRLKRVGPHEYRTLDFISAATRDWRDEATPAG